MPPTKKKQNSMLLNFCNLRAKKNRTFLINYVRIPKSPQLFSPYNNAREKENGKKCRTFIKEGNKYFWRIKLEISVVRDKETKNQSPIQFSQSNRKQLFIEPSKRLLPCLFCGLQGQKNMASVFLDGFLIGFRRLPINCKKSIRFKSVQIFIGHSVAFPYTVTLIVFYFT